MRWHLSFVALAVAVAAGRSKRPRSTDGGRHDHKQRRVPRAPVPAVAPPPTNPWAKYMDEACDTTGCAIIKIFLTKESPGHLEKKCFQKLFKERIII